MDSATAFQPVCSVSFAVQTDLLPACNQNIQTYISGQYYSDYKPSDSALICKYYFTEIKQDLNVKLVVARQDF